MVCLQEPSPAAPWTYHARQAQAAERGRDWSQASKEWKRAEQAAEMFGGADEAQLGSMGERDDGAQRVRTWLHEQEQDGLRSTDWYLTEASSADGRGDQMLAYTLYRQAWMRASRVWRRDVRQGSANLDLAIAMTKELGQKLALA